MYIKPISESLLLKILVKLLTNIRYMYNISQVLFYNIAWLATIRMHLLARDQVLAGRAYEAMPRLFLPAGRFHIWGPLVYLVWLAYLTI